MNALVPLGAGKCGSAGLRPVERLLSMMRSKKSGTGLLRGYTLFTVTRTFSTTIFSGGLLRFARNAVK